MHQLANTRVRTEGGDRASARLLERGNHLLRPNRGLGESNCRFGGRLFRARAGRFKSLTCCHVFILA